MQAYMTVSGTAIPFFVLSEKHRDYLERCRREWEVLSADEFAHTWRHGPWPQPKHGYFLGINLLAEPLSQILFDMWWRLRVAEGQVEAEPGLDLRDPFRDAGPASPAPA